MTFNLFSLCFELKTVRVPSGYKPPGSRAPVWGLLACRHFKFTCWAQAVPRSAHIATPKKERVNRDRDWLEVNDLGALWLPHAAVWTSMQTHTFLNPWFFKGEFSPRKLHPQFFSGLCCFGFLQVWSEIAQGVLSTGMFTHGPASTTTSTERPSRSCSGVMRSPQEPHPRPRPRSCAQGLSLA